MYFISAWTSFELVSGSRAPELAPSDWHEGSFSDMFKKTWMISKKLKQTSKFNL